MRQSPRYDDKLNAWSTENHTSFKHAHFGNCVYWFYQRKLVWSRWSNNAPNWVRLAQNKINLVLSKFSVHFGLLSTTVLKTDLESPRFVSFGPIWPNLGLTVIFVFCYDSTFSVNDDKQSCHVSYLMFMSCTYLSIGWFML